MLLQKNGWDLEKAIESHFGGKGPGKKSSSSVPKESNSTPVQASTRAPEEFSLLTWNIDGLDEKSLDLRCRAVCQQIVDKRVTIACLQEVVPSTLKLIRETLPEYQVQYTSEKLIVTHLTYSSPLLFLPGFV